MKRIFYIKNGLDLKAKQMTVFKLWKPRLLLTKGYKYTLWANMKR